MAEVHRHGIGESSRHIFSNKQLGPVFVPVRCARKGHAKRYEDIRRRCARRV